jgi:PAS domain-containing protein
LIEHVTRELEPWMNEMRMRRHDGEEIYVQVSATCSRDADGDPVGIVFSFADVTAHRRVEEALRHAQEELEKADGVRALELSRTNLQLQEDLARFKQENTRLRREITELRNILGRPPPS